MRNYNLLWGLWAVWALAVIAWLMDIHKDSPLQTYGLVLAVVLGAGALMAFFYKVNRSHPMFSFDKNKKSAAEPQERSALNSPTELVNSVSPVRVRKDAFISQGARMEGKLAADGDITVEGEIEGDVCCNNTIKVEHSGKVTGELTSQQIIINGRVEGRIYAGSVTILAQGKVVGDIFSDELSIEKGGVFTGKSNPLQAEQRAQEALACAEKADGPTENENVMALVENDPLA